MSNGAHDSLRFDIVPWNSSFDTGIATIDEQHRRLVDLLNALAKQYVGGATEASARAILDELVAYTHYHFESEEAIWHGALGDDAWARDHDTAHHNFVSTVGELVARLDANCELLPLLDSTLAFLTRWLANHILYDDKRMAAAVGAVRSGTPIEQAKEVAQAAMTEQVAALIRTVLSMYEMLSSRTLALQRETNARLRAEEALRNSEENWRLVLGSTHDGLWDWQFDSQTRNHEQEATLRSLIESSLGEGMSVAPDDWPGVQAALADHLAGRSDIFSMQHRVIDRDGQLRWVHSRGKVVARDVLGLPLRIVGTHSDVTENKTVEMTLRLERDAGRMISQLATEFMATSTRDFDAVIHRALQRSGEFMRADRAYVFLLDAGGRHHHNTHEWCAPGIEPQIDTLQNIPIEATPWWWEQLHDHGQLVVSDVEQLPAAAEAEKAILQAQDIRSVCIIALRRGGRVIGFAGFDAVAAPRDWNDLGRRFLYLVGDLLSIAINHRRTLETLQDSEDRYRRLFESLSDAVLVIDTEKRRIVTGNPAAARLTGHAVERLEGLAFRQLFPPEAHHDLARLFAAHEHDDPETRQLSIRHADGRDIEVELGSGGNYLQHGHAYSIGILHDLSERAAHQRELEHLAFHDPLTGLPNRESLNRRLQRALLHAQSARSSLVLGYIDLDDFAEINEHQQHEVGDRFLVALGHRLQPLFEQPDSLFRFGGDEFAFVIDEADADADCLPFVNRLLATIATPVDIDGALIHSTASIGLARFPQEFAVDGDQLLRQAQQALYQAKLAGKNRIHVYDPRQEQVARDQASLSHEIARALREREFLLYYQPKVDMRHGTVIGVEALIRWRHPQRGMIPPGAFLPMIKDQALEIELGEWVIRTALAQMDAWRLAGLRLPVSVNISASQLQMQEFPSVIERLLSEFPAIAPAMLELEVLESSAMQDLPRVSQIMHRCRQLGVGFALDDFGTGYSSLTYLKHLPASLLKIDQGFVRDMLDNPDELSIIAGVVGMAHAFGMGAIAEGVESAEHGEMLLRLGCELAQGYGISPPLPAEAIPAWQAQWRPPSRWTTTRVARSEDRAVLFAMIDHRHWTCAVNASLGDHGLAPPDIDVSHCRLGTWLRGEGRARYGGQLHFKWAEAHHNRIHEEATELLLRADSGDEGVLAEGRDTLKASCERLSVDLKRLLDEAPSGGPLRRA